VIRRVTAHGYSAASLWSSCYGVADTFTPTCARSAAQTRTGEPPMPLEPFDEYKLFVEDTGRTSDRRQTVNNIYLSVNSVLLGAVAILVQQGQLRSFLFLVVEIFIAIAGYFICNDWRKLITQYRKLLAFRFEQLRGLEATMPGSTKMYSKESEYKPLGFAGDKQGFFSIEIKLPTIFQVLYVAGTILFVAVTVLQRLGYVTQLEQWFFALFGR
jgi:hypothetical protein